VRGNAGTGTQLPLHSPSGARGRERTISLTCGCRILVRSLSRDQAVLVDEPAEDLHSSETQRVEIVDRLRRGSQNSWSPLIQGAVRMMLVVVSDVVGSAPIPARRRCVRGRCERWTRAWGISRHRQALWSARTTIWPRSRRRWTDRVWSPLLARRSRRGPPEFGVAAAWGRTVAPTGCGWRSWPASQRGSTR